MFKLSGDPGSFGYGETSGEDRDPSEVFAGKTHYKDIIRKADSVPLSRLFRHYGLRLDRYNRKTTCPFKFHKGGRENSASFYYYPETNSFRCFGCNTGNKGAHSVDFMSAMDGSTKIKAAARIIDMFSIDIDEDAVIIDKENFSEKLEIMLAFSNEIKEFRRTYNDTKSQLFIENICQAYDALNTKRELSNDALREIVLHLKAQIELYNNV